MEEEGVILGFPLGLKPGSTLRYLVKVPDRAYHGGTSKNNPLVGLGGASPNLTLQQSGRCPHPTHREDRENVVHCLRPVINAHWRIMVHILTPFPFHHSLELCNCETQHTADTQTIPILIICCPEAIYKHQWLILPAAPQLPGAAHQLVPQAIPNRETL